jgi:nucleoside-diphosphate-sugar epimerase
MYEIRGAPRIYEPTNGTLISVDTPIRPSGLYGVWKAFGEALGRYYSDEFGIKVGCLRIAMTKIPGDLKRIQPWLKLTEQQARQRIAAMYVSHRDIARLVRAILVSNVPFGIVYAVGDNKSRFLDLEAGRTLYGFWPIDGIKCDPNELDLEALRNV